MTESAPEATPSAFKAEKPARLKAGFTRKQLRNYNADLDLELIPQWSEGPFAIATRSYLYDRQLFIELQAKGQNIYNLMEHSNLAQFRVLNTVNENNVNIQVQSCQDNLETVSFFNDFDGEQEAYINDEFVSFFTKTANHRVQIKPGHSIKQIKSIQGDIQLRLPVNIQQQKFKTFIHGDYLEFNNFGIVINHYNKTRLDISIIGTTEEFITLRAYNHQGNIIPAKKHDSRVIFNTLFKQDFYQFKEEIAAIEIFYARKFDTVHYPFKFKPEIKAKTALVNLADINPATYEGQGLSSILKPLDTAAIEDYPKWLGQKQQSIENEGFNISLFLQTTDNEDQMDAVLSVKAVLTPFIQQNLSSIELSLKDDNNQTLYDNYLSFIEKDIVVEDKPTPVGYLNASLALSLPASFFEINNLLNGQLVFTLPTLIKEETIAFPVPGEFTQLNPLAIRLIKMTRQQIFFEINGQIDQLIQLKLYNKNNQLISKPLELKKITQDKAELTLNYYDEIQNLKLVYAEEKEVRNYPFTLTP